MMDYLDLAETAIFIILLLASIVALGVVIDRFSLIRKHTGKKAASFFDTVVDKLRNRDMDAARICAQTGEENAYQHLASFSLMHYHKGRAALAEMMEGKIIRERVGLEKRLVILSTLGNNAPFIGLLGTVLGVIKAFHGLGTLGNSGSELVMRSISTALLATAAGLFVAIPVVMANNILVRKIHVITRDLEVISKEILATYHEKKGGE